MTTNLPEPQFIDRDPQQVEASAIALFEQLTDRKLYPAQPERLLLDVLAYRETLVRVGIQEAAKQGLVNYALGTNLDELGALLDVSRLPASSALSTLEFTKDIGAIGFSVLIPQGTRVSSSDGLAIFATTETLIVPSGQPSATVGERLLMLTGVRLGESAVRDGRIAVSCTKDGGECGQGWFQHNTAPNTDTLAPIVHWRVCQVWDWLLQADIEYGFPTYLTAEAYGMNQSDGEEHLSMRTGCIGCPLVTTQDTALANLCRNPKWAYLSPLLKIRGIHDELRNFSNRLRKDGSEIRKNGKLVKNPGRVGALKLKAREQILERVLAIQSQVNTSAQSLDMPKVWIINAEEEARIRELIALKTFPNKWTGNEMSGDALIPEFYEDGSVQPLLFDPKSFGL